MSDTKSRLFSSQISDERNKKTITDAIHHCLVILRENNHYVPDDISNTDTLSRRSALYGFEMFEFIKNMAENLASTSVDSKDFVKLEPIIKKEKDIIVKSEDTIVKNETEISEEPEGDKIVKTEVIEPTEEPEDTIVETVEPTKNSEKIKTAEIEELNRRRYATRIKNRAGANRVFNNNEEEESELESNKEDDCDDSDNDESFAPPTKRRRKRRNVITDDEDDSDTDSEDVSDDNDDDDLDDAVDDDNDDDGSDSDSEDDDGNDENKDSTNKKKSSHSRKKHVLNILSLEDKKKIVDLAKKHPYWSLQMINKHSGCRPIKHTQDLARYKKQVEIGGSSMDRKKQLNAWVYDKYLEHIKENEKFDERTLRKWGLEAKKIFYLDKGLKTRFAASRSWMRRFKKDYKLLGPPTNIPIDRELLKTNNNGKKIYIIFFTSKIVK